MLDEFHVQKVAHRNDERVESSNDRDTGVAAQHRIVCRAGRKYVVHTDLGLKISSGQARLPFASEVIYIYRVFSKGVSGQNVVLESAFSYKDIHQRLVGVSASPEDTCYLLRRSVGV